MQAAAERERKRVEEEERAAVLAAVQEAERAEADGRRHEAEAAAKAQAAQQVATRPTENGCTCAHMDMLQLDGWLELCISSLVMTRLVSQHRLALHWGSSAPTNYRHTLRWSPLQQPGSIVHRPQLYMKQPRRRQ